MYKKGQLLNSTSSANVAERKQTEEELVRLCTAVSISPVGITISDMEGKITYLNEATLKMYGTSDPKDLLGKSSLELIAPEDRGKALAGVKDVMEKGYNTDQEYHVVTKSGSRILTETSTSLIKSKTGEAIGFVATFKDITERRRMEQEIKDKNERLEAANEELRAANEELQAIEEELRAANQELQASNEELEAVNQELRKAQEQLIRSEKLAAIGQLAGGVGHELRNPLGAIKNAAYYIKGKMSNSKLGQREPRVMEFLDIIEDEINTSNKIINDLLGFSRVRKPSVSPVKVGKVVEDALSHTAIPENIEVAKNLDADLPEVEIDPDQIQQVFVNMITNAVQAMPEGGKLTIDAREKGKFMEVEVADTGSGIPEESINKVFDPLFTTKAKGIGLGLAVCKAIIDRHEGNIEVRSEVGRGTAFSVRLPLKREHKSNIGGK